MTLLRTVEVTHRFKRAEFGVQGCIPGRENRLYFRTTVRGEVHRLAEKTAKTGISMYLFSHQDVTAGTLTAEARKTEK